MLSQEEVESRLKNKNLILLSKFTRIKDKHQVLCHCGNTYSPKLSNVFSGTSNSCGCLVNPTLTQEIVKERLKLLNLELLSTYVKNDIKITVLCYCGKKFNVRPVSIFNGATLSCGCRKKASWIPRREDVIGHKFNRLTVIEYVDAGLVKCLCDCGKYKNIRLSTIKNELTKSCGCLKADKLADPFGTFKQKIRASVTLKMSSMIGEKPNMLTVVSYYIDSKGTHKLSCVCECGKEKDIMYSNILTTKSCGCLKKRKGKDNPLYKHDKDLDIRYSTELRKWAQSVFRRDGRKCVICGESKKLNAHHMDSFNWCKDSISDITNGVTTCVNCHREFHSKKNYGSGWNTKAQFTQFCWRKGIDIESILSERNGRLTNGKLLGTLRRKK